MSTVRDRNVIDVTLTENDRYVLIINDDLKTAAEELSAIITASHCRFEDRKSVLQEEGR